MEIDKLLGKRVITGDGRLWRITTIDPACVPTLVTMRLQGTGDPAIGATYGRNVDAQQLLKLPLWLVVGALDYGLLEEV